jgi:hypothetical protein
MDYNTISNREFGLDYDQLDSNEQEWVRDEYDNICFGILNNQHQTKSVFVRVGIPKY